MVSMKGFSNLLCYWSWPFV